MQLWVIITGLAFLMVLGSILWIMPSTRDRRIAKLRQAAIMKKIKVKLIKYPMINISGRTEEGVLDAAAYSFDGLEHEGLHSGWMLIRSFYQVTGNVTDEINDQSPPSEFEGWGWYIRQAKLPAEINDHFWRLLDEYQDQVKAISVMSGGITIGWNEEGTADDLVKFQEWADKLKLLLVSYFNSIEDSGLE